MLPQELWTKEMKGMKGEITLPDSRFQQPITFKANSYLFLSSNGDNTVEQEKQEQNSFRSNSYQFEFSKQRKTRDREKG